MSSQRVILVRTKAGSFDACWDDGTGACRMDNLSTDPDAAITEWNDRHPVYPAKTACTGTHPERHPNTYHPCARTDQPCPIGRTP